VNEENVMATAEAPSAVANMGNPAQPSAALLFRRAVLPTGSPKRLSAVMPSPSATELSNLYPRQCLSPTRCPAARLPDWRRGRKAAPTLAAGDARELDSSRRATAWSTSVDIWMVLATPPKKAALKGVSR
jgi:hypothetical protein